jgi:site-specific recombinase XerD
MLSLYRRHLDNCRHLHLGRKYTKCACSIHCDGILNGKRLRQSMNTSNWARAIRSVAELEAGIGQARKPVAEAVGLFLASRQVEPSTAQKYKRIMGLLTQFAASRGISGVGRITLEDLDAYRSTRKLKALTWSKELQLLRTFFEFCRKRKWSEENPARDMDMPSNPKPRPREPYTVEEIGRIVSACDTFGKAHYERLRARAMILLMRYYGLRVSDVATLRRDRVRATEIFLHALKNGASIWLPLYPDVKFALEAVPPTMGAPDGCPYVFWTGLGDRDGHIRTVIGTLHAVFKKSGVEGASAHRFRHTLATEVLVKGGSIEDAANVLGDSPNIIRKHYAKWSPAYQQRTVDLFHRIHGMPVDSGTLLAHQKNAPASPLEGTDSLAVRVGFEPTEPAKVQRFSRPPDSTTLAPHRTSNVPDSPAD